MNEGSRAFSERGWHPSCGRRPFYFLQPDDRFRVHPTSPRLYFRREDIDWIRARTAGPLSEAWRKLRWMADGALKIDPASDKVAASPKGWNGRKGRAAALVALLTGEEKYLSWSIRWAKHMGTYPVPTPNHGGKDTAVRARLQRMAVVYDWLKDRMSDADRAEIRRA